MSSSGQKRATVVQIKRRVHETAAEAVSIGPKRAKTAAPEAVAAAEAVVPAETVRAEAAASEAAAAAAAAARSARAGERVVLKRLQSFTQRDIDQGEHLKLLRKLRKEQPEEYAQRGVKAASLAAAAATSQERAQKRAAAQRTARLHVVEQRRLAATALEDTALFGTAADDDALQVLVIETVGVQNERKMREAHDAFKGLGITMNDVPMQARVLTQEEEAERARIIEARRKATQPAAPDMPEVPIGAPNPQYVREDPDADPGHFAYDYYVAYLDKEAEPAELEVAVEDWADDFAPEETEKEEFDPADEDSNDEDYYTNDYPEADPDLESGSTDDDEDDLYPETSRRRRRKSSNDEEDVVYNDSPNEEDDNIVRAYAMAGLRGMGFGSIHPSHDDDDHGNGRGMAQLREQYRRSLHADAFGSDDENGEGRGYHDDDDD